MSRVLLLVGFGLLSCHAFPSYAQCWIVEQADCDDFVDTSLCKNQPCDEDYEGDFFCPDTNFHSSPQTNTTFDLASPGYGTTDYADAATSTYCGSTWVC